MHLVQFIEREEGRDGFQPDGTYKARWDALGKCWSIGPGLTHGITRDTRMTQAEVDAALAAELSSTVKEVDALVKVPLTENRHTVICSFAYNCGVGALKKSTLLKRVNAGQFAAVPSELMKWTRAKGASGPVPGLINRRKAEVALWNTPDDHPAPPISNPSNAPVPKAIKENFMNIIGQIIVGLLANDQMQSVFRTVLKGLGTALIVKAGGDTGSIDTIVGGIIAVIGTFGSVVAHSPSVKAS